MTSVPAENDVAESLAVATALRAWRANGHPHESDDHHHIVVLADEIERLAAKLPCGHNKAENDDSYDGCITCDWQRSEVQSNAEIERLSHRIERIEKLAAHDVTGCKTCVAILEEIAHERSDVEPSK